MHAGSLWQLLEDDDVELNILLRLRMCSDIANGLAFAHNLPGNKFVVHGDMKNENILLNGDLRCKITDFGSGKLSSYTKTSSSASSSQEPHEFTQLYAAPELLENPTASLNRAHDVYSYSIVVYEILARRRVAETNTLINLYLAKVPHGNRPDVSDLEASATADDDNGHVMRNLIQVMKQCWDHDPRKRPIMSNVSCCLQHQLDLNDSATIMQHAVVALKKMDIQKPRYKDSICEPIHKFVCPNYNDTGN